MTLRHFDRDEFLAERWAYENGQHVTILGPTGSGKTYLGYQLLQQSATEQRRAQVLVMKPRDPTALRWGKTLGLRTVRDWPETARVFRSRRHVGWNVWPEHDRDPDEMDDVLYNVFRAAMVDSYRSKEPRIIFGDEIAGLADLAPDPKRGEVRKRKVLEATLKAIYMRGRSMDTGLWGASQRPAEVPQLAYGGASHLLLFRDPDKRARLRYDEIGGVDPGLVREETNALPPHHALYIRREGNRMCTIGP